MMSKRPLALVVLAACCTAVAAQELKVTDKCLAMHEADKRLACYDQQLAYKPEKPPEVKKRPEVTWKVRDSGTVSPVGDADIGTKAAQFQYGKEDEKSFTKVKVAAVGVLKPINEVGFFEGWSPFVGASWDRDTGAKTPKNTRQVFVGITGAANEAGPGGVAFLPTFRLGYKDDTRAHSGGGWANAHVDVIALSLVDDPEDKGLNSKAIVPYFGLYSAATHTSPSKPADGTYYGPYLGLKTEFKLGAILDRLSLNVKGQVYHDAHAPAGIAKVRHRFGSAGFQYDLVDPKAKKGWVPSISLTWQKGTDPVTGEGPGEKTLLGLTVKYD
jgi:hypothetical protein